MFELPSNSNNFFCLLYVASEHCSQQNLIWIPEHKSVIIKSNMEAFFQKRTIEIFIIFEECSVSLKNCFPQLFKLSKTHFFFYFPCIILYFINFQLHQVNYTYFLEEVLFLLQLDYLDYNLHYNSPQLTTIHLKTI